MKHHYTLSERLAKGVYQILQEGGLVDGYTDMISSGITNVSGSWTMPGWGKVENPIQQIVIFVCDYSCPSKGTRVEIILMGRENKHRTRDWRLRDVYVIKHEWEHAERERIDLPICYDVVLGRINEAKAELKKQEVMEKLFDLTQRNPFPPEKKS